MSNMKNRIKTSVKIAVAAGLVFAIPEAMAGTTGTEFQTVYVKFKDWIQGYGGAAVSVAAIGLGGLASLARQTPFPILTGIGSAILLQYSPDVVGGIISATI
jgi:conjugal transfer pilus assembly protein TraA